MWLCLKLVYTEIYGILVGKWTYAIKIGDTLFSDKLICTQV